MASINSLPRNQAIGKPFILSSQDGLILKKKLVATLKPGKANAIKGSDLAYQLGERDDRKIRIAIGELITEGIPIASSVSEPMGFFIVSNPDEAGEYIRNISARIREMTNRLNDFKRASSKYKPPEQLVFGGVV